MRIAFLLMFFSSFLVGQGIEPSSFQGNPTKNGILTSINQIIGDFGDTTYQYNHNTFYDLMDSLNININDSIYVSNDTIFLRDGEGFATIDTNMVKGLLAFVQNNGSSFDGLFTSLDFTGTTGMSDGIDNVEDADNNPINESNTSVTWTNAGNVLTVFDNLGPKSATITGFIESEVDGLINNEGSLTLTDLIGSVLINSNTSGSTPVVLTGQYGIITSRNSNEARFNLDTTEIIPFINRSEVDGDVTNELDTMFNYDGTILVDGGTTKTDTTLIYNKILDQGFYNDIIYGLGVAESASSYGVFTYENIDSINFEAVNTLGTGQPDDPTNKKGMWLIAGTGVGANIDVTAPYGVIIGNSIARGSTEKFGRLETCSGCTTFDENYPDSVGQMSYHLAKATKYRWYNHGIGGQKTTDIVNRWDRDVLAKIDNPADGRGDSTLLTGHLPYAVLIHIGINDITIYNDIDSIKNRMIFFAQSCQENAIRCYFNNIGVNDSYTLNGIRDKRIDDINIWMNSGVLQSYGATVFDFNSFMKVNPDDSNTTYDASKSLDGVHPTPSAYEDYVNEIIATKKIPILKDIKVYDRAGPLLGSYRRLTGIRIDGEDFNPLPMTDLKIITIDSSLSGQVINYEILASTPLTGTTYTGLSHIEYIIDNHIPFLEKETTVIGGGADDDWTVSANVLYSNKPLVGINETNPLYPLIVKDSIGAPDGSNIAFIGDRTNFDGLYVKEPTAGNPYSVTIQSPLNLTNGTEGNAGIILGGSRGTSGQVLTSNGASAASWTTLTPSTDNQTLTLASRTLSISGGNSQTFTNWDDNFWNDVTTTTSFGGDVSGTYNNINSRYMSWNSNLGLNANTFSAGKFTYRYCNSGTPTGNVHALIEIPLASTTNNFQLASRLTDGALKFRTNYNATGTWQDIFSTSNPPTLFKYDNSVSDFNYASDGNNRVIYSSTNSPASGSSGLSVGNPNTNKASWQIASNGTSDLFFRKYNGTVWDSWIALLTSESGLTELNIGTVASSVIPIVDQGGTTHFSVSTDDVHLIATEPVSDIANIVLQQHGGELRSSGGSTSTSANINFTSVENFSGSSILGNTTNDSFETNDNMPTQFIVDGYFAGSSTCNDKNIEIEITRNGGTVKQKVITVNDGVNVDFNMIYTTSSFTTLQEYEVFLTIPAGCTNLFVGPINFSATN